MTPGEKKLVALLSSSTLALLGAFVTLALGVGRRAPSINTQAALADPAIRAEVVERLTRTSSGVWDSHNDPDVGRMLQPRLKEAIATGVLTQTNSLGLRERQFELPKPAGVLRVVLLGDSFVQGFGVEAQDRAGVVLERYLREHATGWKGELECLHVAVGGWNAVAECAYLRRMLTELAPDLVLHVLVTNDLDDHMAARGFGGLASFAPLRTNHTDALVYHAFPTPYTSPRNTNYLLMAADYESRHRYEEMAAAIGKVVPLLRQSGSRYLAVSYWINNSTKLWHFLEEVIRPEEFAILPKRLMLEPENVLSATDGHWSKKGHDEVARLLFTLIRTRGFLPALALTSWPEVEARCAAEFEESWQEVSGKQHWWLWDPPKEGLSSLEPARFTELEWRHVYTGLDDQAQVSPFASFYLARRGQASLRIRGRALARPEIAGARLRASVEGSAVGEHELVPGQPFDVRFPLPEELEPQCGVNVRLESSDYVYTGYNLQHCISFVLEQLALE